MSLADEVADALPEAVVERGDQNGTPLIVTDPEHLHELMATAKETGFDHLACLTAVDWPKDELEDNADWLGFEIEREVEDPGEDEEETVTEQTPSKGWELDDVDDGLMEVVYNLYSYEDKEHLCVQVLVPRETEACQVPSVADLWKGANWHEREVYDLYGVTFDGHPDMRRIFMPEDWEGHPHRKDYDVSEQQYIYREGGVDKVTKDPGKGW